MVKRAPRTTDRLPRNEGPSLAVFLGFAELIDSPSSRSDIQARFEAGRFTLSAGSAVIGDWARSDIVLSRSIEGFVLEADDEALLLSLADPEAFWAAACATEQRLSDAILSLTIDRADEESPDTAAADVTLNAPPRWWRFWEAATWRGWWARRVAWRLHRREVRSLESDIAASRGRLTSHDESLDAARRDLRWAAEIGPRSVPVRTARAETGLATVEGVTLLELRKRKGAQTWMPIDSGAVHLTDRKMVFSGSKNVEFRFERLTLIAPRGDGLHLKVSSRRRPQVLAGPTEHLVALLTACRAVAAGATPTDPFQDRVDHLTQAMAAERTRLDQLTRTRSMVVAPPRPVSPAWLPVSFVLLTAAFLAAPPEQASVAAPADASATTIATTAGTTTPISMVTTLPPAPPTTTAAITVAVADEEPPTATTVAAAEVDDAGRTVVEGELVVHYFDVGQGDSTLLTGPDFTIVVDAGRHDRSDVVGHLHNAGVDDIDLLVGTHPHADHIGQIPEVLHGFDVTEVWMSGDAHTTLTYERVIDAILGSDAGYHEPRAGEVFEIGSARVEVLNPSTISGDLHEGSISLRVVYGDVAFMFTGDAEASTELEMVASGRELGAQVLKVGHHGSGTATAPEFLEAVDPVVAVYSAGSGNQYGHPHRDVVGRLQARGIDVYGTDVHGTVTITTDGEHYTVSTGSSDALQPIASTPTTTTTTTTEAPTTTAPVDEGACAPGQVDINTAGFEELQAIIHIDPDRAQQILDLRPFASVDAMDRINGIASVRLADIKAQGVACAS